MRTVLVVSALLLTLSGCGEATSPERGARDVDGGDEPVTPAALAYAAAQQVGDPDSATTEHDISDELGAGSVGADLQFDAGPGDDGDRLTVAVGTRTPDGLNCTADHDDGGGCVVTGQGTVVWENGGVGEDPGNVGVAVRKGGTTVLVFQSGPLITGDPRELHLRITVADMFAIATDPHVDLSTSRGAVTAGTRLSYWTD